MSMRYMTISYTVVYPNPACEPEHVDHILLRTPDGERFFHPEGGPSHFYLKDFVVHEDHGELDIESDWDQIEALILDNAREHWQPEKAIRESAGWLSPDGDFYPCQSWEHDGRAETICRAVLGILKGTRHLEEAGWARVYDDGLVAYRTPGLTQKQRDTIFDLYELATDAEYKEEMGHAIEIYEHRRRAGSGGPADTV